MESRPGLVPGGPEPRGQDTKLNKGEFVEMGAIPCEIGFNGLSGTPETVLI